MVWFLEEDVKRLITANVKDTVDRYLADTTIPNARCVEMVNRLKRRDNVRERRWETHLQ